jgi:hypothetical protein
VTLCTPTHKHELTPRRTNAHANARTCARARTCAHACARACTHVCARARARTHAHTRTHAHMHTHTRTHAHTHAHARTHTDTRTHHTHTHTRTRTRAHWTIRESVLIIRQAEELGIQQFRYRDSSPGPEGPLAPRPRRRPPRPGIPGPSPGPAPHRPSQFPAAGEFSSWANWRPDGKCIYQLAARAPSLWSSRWATQDVDQTRQNRDHRRR